MQEIDACDVCSTCENLEANGGNCIGKDDLLTPEDCDDFSLLSRDDSIDDNGFFDDYDDDDEDDDMECDSDPFYDELNE